MFDGPEELVYIKKFTDIFQDKKFREFFTVDVLKKQVEDEFQEKLKRVDAEDEFYPALLESIQQTKAEKLEAIHARVKKMKNVPINLILITKSLIL